MLLRDMNSAMHERYRGFADISRTLSKEEGTMQDTYIKVNRIKSENN